MSSDEIDQPGSTSKGRGSRFRSRRLSSAVVGVTPGRDTTQEEDRAPSPSSISDIGDMTLEEESEVEVPMPIVSVERGGAAARRGMATTAESSSGLGRRFDVVRSRKEGANKTGTAGAPVKLQGNYFVLHQSKDWSLYRYDVQFSTEIDNLRFRKKLLRDSAESKIGKYIFDGAMMCCIKELDSPMTFEGMDTTKNEKVQITVTFTGQLLPGDDMYLQLYNIILRKCLFGMELLEMGRHFYDPDQPVQTPHGLELWPGYMTSMRNHEKNPMLCVEITHKVIRTETVLEILNKLKSSPGDYQAAAREALIGCIVITSYNKKTYRVDDINWNKTPNSIFERKGVETSFFDYFKSVPNCKPIRDMKQPLLCVSVRAKDLHRGKFGKTSTEILLVPELCQPTGLTDALRANFTVMRGLAEHLHMVADKRVAATKRFMTRLLSKPDLVQELRDWGLEFKNELVNCQGRVMPKEGIYFASTGDNRPEMPNDKADWTMAFRKRQMLTNMALNKWTVVLPTRDAPSMDNVVKTMIQVGKPLGFMIRPPTIVKLPDIRVLTYTNALDALKTGDNELIFVVLPNNKLDLYSAVKKRTSGDYGIPSQCMLAKNLTNKGLMSIATKIVIQINAKLGGEPWSVQVPLKNTMIVGFDAYRGGSTMTGPAGKSRDLPDERKSGIGALVSTTNATFSRYFSTTCRHTGNVDLSNNLKVEILKCVRAWKKENGHFPERIIFYRDGVGEGDLTFVFQVEMRGVQDSLNDYYLKAGVAAPKFTFIVVNKRVNTRLMTLQPDNPPPGTVVDDIVTFPERFDFYLIATSARQGTVSPCSYNVLHDGQELGAERLQRLTYKMCHLYYNWSGTVAVPAPCQYAHKLAFLEGMALGGPACNRLENLLHFL